MASSYQPWVPFSAFISHKTSQPELLVAATQRLKAAGIHVNVAEWQPYGGRPLYNGKIKEMLQSSDCLIVLMTAEAAASPDVNQELGAFWDKSKPIIPFVQHGLTLTGVLSGVEGVYFYPMNPQPALDDLVTSVTRWRQRKQNEWVAVGIAGATAFGLGIAQFFQGKKQQGQPSADDQLLTIQQAAQYSGYSESSVRRWIRDGDLRYWEDDYGTRYVSKKEFHTFLITTGRA